MHKVDKIIIDSLSNIMWLNKMEELPIDKIIIHLQRRI